MCGVMWCGVVCVVEGLCGVVWCGGRPVWCGTCSVGGWVCACVCVSTCCVLARAPGGVVCGVVWCGMVWCVVWCGAVRCGVMWCGVVWCGGSGALGIHVRYFYSSVSVPFQEVMIFILSYDS